MKARRAAQLIAIEALADGLPFGASLHAFDATAARRASDAGHLGSALNRLRFPHRATNVIARWPRAARGVMSRLERLPSRWSFTLQLGQTLTYIAFLLVLQLVTSVVIKLKVTPVLEAIYAGVHPVVPAANQRALEIFPGLVSVGLVLTCCVALWLALGATGWRTLPGWGAHFHRAETLALAAALFETNAPEALRASLVAELPPNLQGDDGLDALFETERLRAEVALTRTLSLTRTIALASLTLTGASISLVVFLQIAGIPWVS